MRRSLQEKKQTSIWPLYRSCPSNPFSQRWSLANLLVPTHLSFLYPRAYQYGIEVICSYENDRSCIHLRTEDTETHHETEGNHRLQVTPYHTLTSSPRSSKDVSYASVIAASHDPFPPFSFQIQRLNLPNLHLDSRNSTQRMKTGDTAIGLQCTEYLP